MVRLRRNRLPRGQGRPCRSRSSLPSRSKCHAGFSGQCLGFARGGGPPTAPGPRLASTRLLFKKLSPTQQRYSTFDRELQAAFSAVRHFRFLLEGRRFRLLTDHKPLVAAMSRVTPPWSARQQRQMAYLSEFTSDFCHTSGTANVVADALSRPPSQVSITHPSPAAGPPATAGPSNVSDPAVVASLPSGTAVDFAAMAEAQRHCPDIVSMRASPTIQVIYWLVGDVHLLGDISTGVFRPFVPAAFRTAVIKSVHDIHHPGVKATTRLVTAAFCWPHMGRDVAAAARSCMGCQKGKIHKHIHLQPDAIPVPQRRFAHIHVDLVGPLPKSSGFTHLFTIMDRTTRWPEAIPLSATSSSDCAAALLRRWIQRFGVPTTITSDRGPQFTAALWAATCRLLSISHVPTTAYHPQANGLVERFHRRLKDALRARASGSDWYNHLPWVLLGIRSTWREDSQFSPAEVFFGSQPVLPGQFLDTPEPPTPNFLAEFQGVLQAGRCRRLLASRYLAQRLSQRISCWPVMSWSAEMVRKRRSLLSMMGPYLVLERSLRFFKLQVGQKTDTVSTLRLKVCRSPPDVAVPPKRGRPSNASKPANMPVAVPSFRKPRKKVSFACPAAVIVYPPPTQPGPPTRPPTQTTAGAARRSARSTTRPSRYTS
jgi:hypothetical protein